MNPGSVRWVLHAFESSPRFARLSAGTQLDYRRQRAAIEAFPTRDGRCVGDLVATRLTATHVFKMLESVAAKTPSKANHMLRYLRRALRWAGPGVGLRHNPAWGLECFPERKRQRLPGATVYTAVLQYARQCGQRPAHARGSCPPYLWLVMELAYLCRLRGIEVCTLTEVQGTAEGLRTQRRKGSRNNVVYWNPRLRLVWHAALSYRQAVLNRYSLPHPLNPEQRWLFPGQDGRPLAKTALDSAWQRFIRRAIADGIISPEQRFSLHDLKRQGVTDTPGTFAEKQTAAGLTEAMMKVYDFSLPRVPAAAS